MKMARIDDLQAVSHLRSHLWNLHWLLYSSLLFLIFNDFHGYLDMQPLFQRGLIKESLIISFFLYLENFFFSKLEMDL
jgi:hypothetical protein